MNEFVRQFVSKVTRGFTTNTTKAGPRKLVSIEVEPTSFCYESYPCQHTSGIKFIYNDGTVVNRGTNGFEVLRLCKENNIQLPSHFTYMAGYAPPKR